MSDTSNCKLQRWGAGVVIWLELGADLHMAQLVPLPLTISCFIKIQIGFTILVQAHPGSPGKRAVKWVCVCVFQLQMTCKNWCNTNWTMHQLTKSPCSYQLSCWGHQHCLRNSRQLWRVSWAPRPVHLRWPARLGQTTTSLCCHRSYFHRSPRRSAPALRTPTASAARALSPAELFLQQVTSRFPTKRRTESSLLCCPPK